jgi:hypothetical protein
MRDDEVFVDVHFCGMCHSDIHSEYGSARPPIRARSRRRAFARHRARSRSRALARFLRARPRRCRRASRR